MDAGYLGVGNMGQPMAHKLLDAGHSLTIFDISEAAMRAVVETPGSARRLAARLGRFAASVETGMISINHHGLALPEVPFGGVTIRVTSRRAGRR